MVTACCFGSRHKNADSGSQYFVDLEGFPAPVLPGSEDQANKSNSKSYFCTRPVVEDTGYTALPSGDPEDDSSVNKYVRSISQKAAPTRSIERWKEVALVIGGVLASLLMVLLYGPLTTGEWVEDWELLELASIPVVAMLFTWFHIWLAIQMMFLPIKFVGVWEHSQSGLGLGWQGIVPRKARKMAQTSYVCARPYLEGPRDWLVRVNPRVLVQMIRQSLKQIVEEATAKVCVNHGLEGRLADSLGDMAESSLTLIEEICPSLWNEIVDLLSDKEVGIDNDGMIVKVFTERKELLNKFFMVLGEPEFRFIERCGAAMGLISGLVQLIAFNELGPAGRQVLLPTTGFLLGIFSNWLAILMCFKPCFPRHVRLFGAHLFTIQGLFLKRQPEVCELYSKMLCEHFLIFEKVIEYLQEQPKLWEKLRDAYVRFNTNVMRQTLGFTASWLAPLALGRGGLDQFERDLQEELVLGLQKAHNLHKVSGMYISKATDIEAKNRQALQRMPPDEFENLLHPIFKEDEWILILLGGVLGAIVGLAQILVLS